MSININEELHQNFIDFSYEANSQRAFPDARDGLKPGQRACLWEFFSKGYSSSKPHVKSAKVAGGVIASWWPHGDAAIYETFARMSQPWINNIPEVDWHGANGSVIGGPECASSRYTEARLSKASEDGFFNNIKKNVVNMIPNFSEDEEWPELFPAIFPRLYVNGSQGIGMTIANTWVPGNLGELVTKIHQYIDTGDIDCDNIYPDFPTGGIIINKNDLKTIYETGKGRVVLRAKTSVDGNSIYIHELPYQVYAEPWIDSVKELVTKEEIKGIKDIYNKSDKKKILIEIECENAPLAVLDILFSKTDLQKTYNPNQYALISKVPQMLNLKKYIEVYVNHNLECIRKEYAFELKKAQVRKEIVEGLIKAIEDIDNVIAMIKSSNNAADAKTRLMAAYEINENQAKAIVDMKLGRLAKLEGIELNQESAELTEKINNCLAFLSNINSQNKEFLSRLDAFNNKYGYERRTEVTQITIDKKAKEEVYVEPEKCVVVMTEGGLIKRVPTMSFKVQKRNTKGVKTQDDITASVIRTNTVDSLMVFTNKGTMYRLSVNDIPEGTNASKGVGIKGLINMEPDEEANIIYSIYKDTTAKYIAFVTKNGIVKKTSLDEYIKTKRKTGVSAITLKEGDKLAAALLMESEDLVILTREGKCIRFKSSDVAASGRTTQGMKGINLDDGDEVVAALAIRDPKDNLGIFSVDGYGKRIDLSEIPVQHRGGKGLLCVKGAQIAAAALINDEDNILIIGNMSSVCISGKDVPVLTRGTLGNMMIKNNKIKSVSKV